MLAATCKQGLSFAAGGSAILLRRLSTVPSRVVELKSDEEYNNAVKQLAETGKLGVIDFTAKWCGPCKQIAPILEDFSEVHPQVEFYKVDIDNSAVEGTCTEVGITAVPTFLFIKGPKRLEMFSGARVDLLKNLLETHGGQ